ncbi:MAG: RNA polymerase sigma factor [Methanocorpusculum sp.]|nr:RNA polymerase sigma factor [Methanocorpusculum sp.]
MEDARIIDLYWERAETAIEKTSEKYGSYCYAIAYNILANNEDAAESVNDTYLCAWNSMPPHRPNSLSTFLGKITRRIAIDKWRGLNAVKRGSGETILAYNELSDCIPSHHSVEQEVEAADLAEIIRDFLMRLSQTERRVFICRYWYFDSITDISNQFNFSEGKIKMMLHRTRKRLMKYFVERGVIYDC